MIEERKEAIDLVGDNITTYFITFCIVTQMASVLELRSGTSYPDPFAGALGKQSPKPEPQYETRCEPP